jgi:hypothetical protein
MNTLRLTTSTGLAEIEIETGSAKNARRVPAKFARTALAATDARLEVQTSRGWEARRIVKVGRSYYTRTVTEVAK